ncbi:MAG: hypothetical protein FJ319_02615 [SAR202 cluster bacterium]|nr:hypothetical protein [SAR202 cluster bacterium]
MEIRFLYFEDCSSHEEGLARLKQAMSQESIEARIAVVKVETDEQARQLGFTGSPTILIDGKDIDPPGPDSYPALTCRAYTMEDGRISPLPSMAMLKRALRAARGDQST